MRADGRAVRRRGRRADRQDRRGAEGVLQRAERRSCSRCRPTNWRARRTTSRCASRAGSKRPATSRAGSKRCSSTTCRTTTSPATCRTSRRSPPPTSQRVAQKYIQPDKFAVVVVGDREDDRAGHPRAEPRAGEGDDDRRGLRPEALDPDLSPVGALPSAARSPRAAPESSWQPTRRSSTARRRPTASPDRTERYRRASTSRTA